MEIITVPPTQTRVGLRPAYVLGDPEVWSSAFEVALQDQGFAVAAFRELHELFDRSHDAAPDLLILAKRNAPFAVRACQAVRGLRDAPIIVVIASESDFVPAMDAGADDAVTASSDPIVFTTRVRALLRRAQHWQTGQSAGIIVIRDLLIDLDKCEVVLRNRPVSLTPTEFRILAVLADKVGRVVDARSLLSSVHEHDYDDREAQNLVKVHIANLRRKLEDGRHGNPYILCVRGFGYMLERRSERRANDPLTTLLETPFDQEVG
ncbi:MAG: response regulator transcription factor [Dehalococcoidia bacterium]